MKMLSSEALRAASLLASGQTEEQVAKQLGRSRSWVQNLKRRDDFQLELENLRLGADNAVKEALREFEVLSVETHLQELHKYRKLHHEEGNRYIETAKAALDICQRRIVNLDPADLSIQGLCGLAKVAQLFMEYGSDLVGSSLCVNKLLEYMQEDEESEK